MGGHHAEAWAGRPRVALTVRLAYVLLPLLAACATSALLVRLQAVRGLPVAARWVAVLAVSTALMVIVHRSLSRLLPLAALLELSVEFPGPAPSRYAVARDAGNDRKLREIVLRAQRGDRLVDLRDVEAARDILALVAALRSHDLQTRGHSERVRVFTDLIATQLALTAADREQLRWAALLHDVGKLSVPAAVLNKTDRLTDQDWQLIRRHPATGARITQPLRDWLGTWSDTIAQHHEKYDGTGYPRGLVGEQICLGARIVAVADSFDVMTAARSYRQPIGREAALRELANCSGTHFDPKVVRAMLAVSTPRLRWAMGPLGWLGASPFLAASQGAAAAAAQATAGAVVAGTVVIVGPAAIASPSPGSVTSGGDPTPGGTRSPSSTGHHLVRPREAPIPTPTPSSSATPAPGASGGSGKPTAPPGKPTAPPGRPSSSPSASPSPSGSGSSSPTASPSASPTKRTGKPTTAPGRPPTAATPTKTKKP